jgi:hypothetical protein
MFLSVSQPIPEEGSTLFGAVVNYVDRGRLVSDLQLNDILGLRLLGDYPDKTTTGVDLVDLEGRIARVWVFLQKGFLYARGSKGHPGRDPENLAVFIDKPKRIKVLRLATPRDTSGRYPIP